MLQCNISHFVSHLDENKFNYIQGIPSMQRRRLSHLAKNALNMARLILDEFGAVDYIVWSSRYGDEVKTFDLLQDIANQEMISPTAFSTSVHNAIAGLYSIYFNDHTPSTSISSAAYDVWRDAVSEAYAYLRSNHKGSALVIYYDQPLPEAYQDEFKLTHTIVAGAIISRDNENIRLSLAGDDTVTEDEFSQFIRFWYSDDSRCQMRKSLWQKI